jgi:hypothetical protein
MKSVSKEVTNTIYGWEAIDGTFFDNKEECQRYENSAKTVILAKYNKLVVKSGSEEELFYIGCGDNTVDVVKISKYSDIDVILQLYTLVNGNPIEDVLNKQIERCERALDTNDYLFINRGYNDDYFWVMDTLTDRLNYIANECDSSLTINLEANEEI